MATWLGFSAEFLLVFLVFLVALGFAGSRVLAAAVLSCAGVCSFFLGVAFFLVIPLGFDALLIVGDALALPLTSFLDGGSLYSLSSPSASSE